MTAPDLSNAEFLSKRLARVAKLAGVTMPSGTHEQIAELAGTILGEIARALETKVVLTGWCRFYGPLGAGYQQDVTGFVLPAVLALELLPLGDRAAPISRM